MHLKELRLLDFRNHHDSKFEFSPCVNILLGENGQGKTNVIEAISYLCTTKSFYAGGDSEALKFDAEMFEVSGAFELEHASDSIARVAYERETGRKVFTINRQPQERFSTVIGKYPVVICAPENAPITMGGPSERRTFVDFVLSQSAPSYLAALMEYRRVIKHRNRILSDARDSGESCDEMLGPWDEQLLKLGSQIMSRRKQFVDEFQAYLQSAYEKLVGEEEIPQMAYEPATKDGVASSEEEFRSRLELGLQRLRSVEMKIGASLVGPHRDEFSCAINERELRKFASQGQHKTFLVALKVAEFFYLKERCDETPILLLDDLFSELDERRAQRLLEFTASLSQTFITSTTLHLFDKTFEFGDKARKFYIRSGRIIEDPAMVLA
jgi:DNA replication and repair protein RecF